MKYDIYDIDSFPTFELNSRQGENAYKIDRCNNMDSYADMNLEFNSYVDLGVKEKDKSKVVFPDSEVVNEPLTSDYTFSCLQEADRNCDQQDEMRSFYEEMFLSSLQTNVMDDFFPVEQTSDQDVPDVPSF